MKASLGASTKEQHLPNEICDRLPANSSLGQSSEGNQTLASKATSAPSLLTQPPAGQSRARASVKSRQKRCAYKDLVSDMISRGAIISNEEMATIVEYLYKTYGQK